MTNTIDKLKELEILNKIKSGVDSHTIIVDYQLSYSKLHKLSKKHKILDIFKTNNKKFAKIKCNKKTITLHTEINKDIDIKFGNKIYDLVINKKFTTYDLRSEFKIPLNRIIRFLNYKGIYDVCVKNGKEKIGSLAKVNGKNSTFKLKGIELKPITDEIIEKFKYYKKTLIYKQKVYDAIKKDFGFGEKKLKQLCKRFGYPVDNPQTGKLNPMYGKSPSLKAGIGVKCHLKVNGNLYFCRSSLELKIYMYMINNNIKFIQSKHRVKYKINNVDKTYCPDIIINDIEVCEIKPSVLTLLKENKIKMDSLKKYCQDYNLKCRYITEKDLDLSNYSEFSMYQNLIENKILIIDFKNLEKLKRNL